MSWEAVQQVPLRARKCFGGMTTSLLKALLGWFQTLLALMRELGDMAVLRRHLSLDEHNLKSMLPAPLTELLTASEIDSSCSRIRDQKSSLTPPQSHLGTTEATSSSSKVKGCQSHGCASWQAPPHPWRWRSAGRYVHHFGACAHARHLPSNSPQVL